MGINSEDKKKILIVEDELILSMFEQQLVEQIGCEVVGKVTSGEEALEIFEQDEPDLVLIDIGLRGPMDGIQLIKKIRESSNIPAVVISGESSQHISKLSYEEGFTELVQKPFTSEELINTVERILEL